MNPSKHAKYTKGNPQVKNASMPKVGGFTPPTGSPMTNAKVGSKGIPSPVSSGKMPSSAGVSLGTFHGKHNVNHPVNGN